MSTEPRALRAPDHGRPYDWPFTEDAPVPPPPDLTVWPTEPDECDEGPALYGANGEPIRWRRQRVVGFRRLSEEEPAAVGIPTASETKGTNA